MRLHIAAASVLFLLARPAAACTQDLECGAGARCAKSTGAIYGQCVRDVLSGSPADASAPLPPATASAPRCAFDGDCGKDATCLKTSSDAPGICVKQH
jgi:hypothetical protein